MSHYKEQITEKKIMWLRAKAKQNQRQKLKIIAKLLVNNKWSTCERKLGKMMSVKTNFQQQPSFKEIYAKYIEKNIIYS